MATSKTDFYPTETVEQLLDGPTEIDWIFPSLIPMNSCGLIVGQSGIGKSWLLMDLAIAIATGEKFLGHFPVKQGTVLAVDEENAKQLLRHRMNLMLKARGLKPKDVPIHYLVNSYLNFSPVRKSDGLYSPSPEFVKLLNTSKRINPLVTFFDSLTRVHRANENVSNEMALAFQFVKKYIEQSESTAIFSHHVRKGNGVIGSGDKIRGSTEIRNFVDWTLVVDEVEGGIVLTHDKPRWDNPLPSFRAHIQSDKKKARPVYDGVVGDKKIMDAWQWLRDFLKHEKANVKGRAVTRGRIVEESQSQGVCRQRKMDEVLSARYEADDLDRATVGREAAYWLNGKH